MIDDIFYVATYHFYNKDIDLHRHVHVHTNYVRNGIAEFNRSPRRLRLYDTKTDIVTNKMQVQVQVTSANMATLLFARIIAQSFNTCASMIIMYSSSCT